MDTIESLYYEWEGENNPAKKQKTLESIKQRISPYDFLKFSSKSKLSPFRRFREIYSLEDLFGVFEQLLQNGESISELAESGLVIKDIKDITFLSKYSKGEIPPEIEKFRILFNGINVFKNGDYTSIANRFKNSLVNKMGIEQISQLIQSGENFKGLPIRIDLDNIGELSIQDLESIQAVFDVDSIRVWEKAKTHGEAMQSIFNVSQYRQIRERADKILNQLCIVPRTR